MTEKLTDAQRELIAQAQSAFDQARAFARQGRRDDAMREAETANRLLDDIRQTVLAEQRND